MSTVRPGHRPDRGSAGFTLVEVMIAMLVFSLIAAGTWAALGLAARSVQAGDALAEAHEEVRVVQRLLRRLLSGAIPVALVEARGSDFHVWFEGRAQSIGFIAAAPAWLARGGLHRYRVELVSLQEGGQRLVLRRDPLDDDMRPGTHSADGPTTVLASDVLRARFEYYGDPRDTGLGEWFEEWPRARRLPSLVRMRLATGNVGEWPELMLRPRVDDPLFLDVPAARSGGTAARE